MFSFSATCYHGADELNLQVKIDRLPDSCPMCHHAIRPRQKNVAHVRNPNTRDARLEIVLECPDEDCQHLFIARYFVRYSVLNEMYSLGECVPWESFDSEFSDAIRGISSDFCQITDQAQKAEHQGWDLVAGPGYRKGLEFLVKDYLCRLRPADAETIKKTELGTCINNYIANERIRQTAARALWLGNDEVHYVRKWEDKDLEDLKKLIQLTVHWIEMEELTDSVLKEMPKGKNK